MYLDEVNVINIQAMQLSYIVNQISSSCQNMTSIAAVEPTDKDSLKAYVASIDVLMTSLSSQSSLLQAALDKLSGDLSY